MGQGVMLNWHMREYWVTLLVDGVFLVRIYEGSAPMHAEAMAKLEYPDAHIINTQPAMGWD
jgi:hypothetical protein